jgi:hypothetical protein
MDKDFLNKNYTATPVIIKFQSAGKNPTLQWVRIHHQQSGFNKKKPFLVRSRELKSYTSMSKDLSQKKLIRTAGKYQIPIRWQISYSSVGTESLSLIRFQQKRFLRDPGT